MDTVTIRHPELSENPPARLWDEVCRQLALAVGERYELVKLGGHWLVYRGAAAPGKPLVQRRGKLSTALGIAVGRRVEFVVG